jgi:hypothetical protein
LKVRWGSEGSAPRCVNAKHPWSAVMNQMLSHVLFNFLLTPALRTVKRNKMTWQMVVWTAPHRTTLDKRQTCLLFCKAALRIGQSLVTSLLASPTRVSPDLNWEEQQTNITVIYESDVQEILLCLVHFSLQKGETHTQTELRTLWHFLAMKYILSFL